jgi:hypothetical protein
MRFLLIAILCFPTAATVSATETPSKFTGRWVGIAEFGNSRNPDMNDERALLTIEVDPQGVITNGAIRDFAGHALAGFFGQLDSEGRITTTTFPVQGTIFGQLQINLGQTTGFGTYRARILDRWNFRSTIRFWREKKPTVDNETASSSFLSETAVLSVGNAITNIVVPLAVPAAPSP